MRDQDDARSDSGDPLRYATEYHAPVLYKAVIEGLVTNPSGVYVDGTLGGGGHTAALLNVLDENALVVGIDQDEEALAEVRRRLAHDLEQGRLRLLHGNFGMWNGCCGTSKSPRLTVCCSISGSRRIRSM